MLITLEGQSHFLPCGVPYWGSSNLNDGGSATVPYDYHIGVDYHKSYSHLVVQDSSGETLT
jgi:transposase